MPDLTAPSPEMPDLESPPLPPATTFPIKPPVQWNKYVLGCAMLASMTSVLLGYVIGVMSGAGVFIKADLNINDTQLEILVGIISICSLFGSVAAGRMSDWIGRRLTIIFAAAVFLAGSLMMALAPSYALLMAGRFVAGIAVGYALVIAPVYVAEVAPASTRGFLTTLPEIFINAGILLSYVSNLVFAPLPPSIGWRIMFAAGAVPPVFLAIAVLAMPESPRWLVLQGRVAEARRVLERTSDSPEDVELRLAEIREAAGIGILPRGSFGSSGDVAMPLLQKPGTGEGTWADLLIHPTAPVCRVLVAAIGLQFFQQATGIDSVVLYSPRVFEMAGLRSDYSLAATVVVGFMKMTFILVAMLLADRVGRRPLLLVSVGGMFVSLLGLGTGLMIIGGHPNFGVVLCFAMVVAFVISFSIGLGPIAWVYSSEVFPLRLRAHGASLAAVTNRITSAMVAMTFISLYKAITIAGSFFLYATITAVAWVFIYACLPETRGRTLEEMDMVFDRRSGEVEAAPLKEEEEEEEEEEEVNDDEYHDLN